MNLTGVLALIAEREAAAAAAAARLREQIAALTGELDRADQELADLVTTRTTLRTLAAAEFISDDPTIASAPYQQILEILATATTPMRAKQICLAAGIEPTPNHVEGTRSRLKRMVNRHILTEPAPGTFLIAPKQT